LGHEPKVDFVCWTVRVEALFLDFLFVTGGVYQGHLVPVGLSVPHEWLKLSKDTGVALSNLLSR
jgi:hypothetical protein